MRRLEFVLGALFICHMPLLAQASITMPEELSAYAMSKGCEEVRDFFTRPGVVNPPYVYGYLEGQREGSAVLWCERREGEGRRFRLLVLTRGKTESRCPLMLEWRSYPGGLSIFSDRRTWAPVNVVRAAEHDLAATLRVELRRATGTSLSRRRRGGLHPSRALFRPRTRGPRRRSQCPYRVRGRERQ